MATSRGIPRGVAACRVCTEDGRLLWSRGCPEACSGRGSARAPCGGEVSRVWGGGGVSVYRGCPHIATLFPKLRMSRQRSSRAFSSKSPPSKFWRDLDSRTLAVTQIPSSSTAERIAHDRSSSQPIHSRGTSQEALTVSL